MDHPANAPIASVKYTQRFVMLVILGILLLAVNMRSPIIGFGVVAVNIKAALGLNSQTIGWIGAIPMIAFATSSFMAPSLAKKIGLEAALLLSASLLTLGLLVRVGQASVNYLWVGTVILSLAIAIGNVLIPAIIKQYTPEKVGLIIGIFSLFSSVAAGLSSGFSMYMAEHYGWQFALGVSSWVALLAMLAWGTITYYAFRQRQALVHVSEGVVLAQGRSDDGNIPPTIFEPTPQITPQPRSVWRIPLAWYISGFMGLQSLLYYTLASFLPSLMVDKGLTQAQAGKVGMVFQFIAFPSIMLLTRWVSLGWHLRPLALLASIANLIGVVGLGFFPVGYWVWLWALCTGFGCGIIFTLAMMMFTIKSKNSTQAAQLSGMAQTVGYSIAIMGPVMTGILKDITHGWTVPMAVLSGLMILMVIVGWLATSDDPIE